MTSRADATAGATLGSAIRKPVYFAYFDFDGDPLRANSSGRDITLTGTGDPDIDGLPFIGISPEVVDISSVKSKQGGSDSVTATLSGIPTLDGVMDVIGDRAKWQGRLARLWRIVRDESNTQQGALMPYYTGYMVAASIGAGGDSQLVTIRIETYLTAFRSASNRTYLDQERFDSGDLSARFAIAIANGNTGNPITGGTPTPHETGYGRDYGMRSPIDQAW